MSARRDGTATLTERAKAALRREGEATAPTLARGLGERGTSVHGVLKRGVDEGWCHVARKDGQASVYAFGAAKERT